MNNTAPQNPDPQTPISELWATYKAGGAEALTDIEHALNIELLNNPTAAALVASQIIGESEKDSPSENMAADIFKRAAACVQLKNPMTLVNMFHGCSQRMNPEQAERITREARLFLGQISRQSPGRTVN